MRDSQQSKVYEWETVALRTANLIENHPEIFCELPLEACQSLASKVCEYYSVPVPKVKRHMRKNGKSAYFSRLGYCIMLPEGWACNGVVVIHETAHAIVSHLFSNVESHGAEFMRVYMNCLSKFLGVCPVYLEDSISGLKVLPTSPFPHDKI